MSFSSCAQARQPGQTGAEAGARAFAVSAKARDLLLRAIAIEDPDERRAFALTQAEAFAGAKTNAADFLALAAALGVAARRTPPVESLRLRFASRSRAAIDAAAGLAREEPWVALMDGIWHIEAIRRGGDLAGALVGAEERRGIEALSKAGQAGRSDAALQFAIAMALTGHEPGKHRTQILTALDAAEEALVGAAQGERAVLAPRISVVKAFVSEGRMREAQSLALELL